MYEKTNKMNTQGLGSVGTDRISTLPDGIIEHILTLMPIRDATRTSILASKWRYSWRGMPKLVFTERMVEVSSSRPLKKKYKVANAIFNVLLLHNGPTKLEFSFPFYELPMVCECDLMIGYLSRVNSVKELSLRINQTYQPPASFFSMQGLESIRLYNVVFEPPLTFNGFSRLKSMVFVSVKVSAQTLLRFLSNCPLLEHIDLDGRDEDSHFVTGGNTFTFAALLQCVPLIKRLEVSEDYVKCLSAGGMPHKLPASLAHLKYLSLDVCLMEKNEISSALCIIRSSLVLEEIIIWMYDNDKLPVRQTPANLFDPDDFPDLILDNLETFEICGFRNLPLEREFVKLIMAKSPVLKKAELGLKYDVSVDKKVKMLRDLALHSFPRASPSAKLIVTYTLGRQVRQHLLQNLIIEPQQSIEPEECYFDDSVNYHGHG